MIPKRFTLISICHKSYSTRCLFVLSSCSIFFSYVNELPLFQFSVISFVLNEVICFSTFIPLKTFIAQVVELFVAFAYASAKSWFLSCSLRTNLALFFFSVEILSNWQSIFSSFSTFKNWKPSSKHLRRSSAIMADRRKYKFLCLAESVT